MRRVKYVMTIVSITVGILPVFFGSRALFRGYTQSLDTAKKITRPAADQEPLEVVKAESDQRTVAVGTKFAKSGDWLKGFSITFTNSTKRNIVAATFYLTFPETRKTGNPMAFTLLFGPPHPAAMRGERTSIIAPGEDFTISLNDKQYAGLKTFVESRQPLASLSEVELTVSILQFDDGTAWAGKYRIQDPKRPGFWIEEPEQIEVTK